MHLPASNPSGAQACRNQTLLKALSSPGILGSHPHVPMSLPDKCNRWSDQEANFKTRLIGFASPLPCTAE